jgi:hypothetical protein
MVKLSFIRSGCYVEYCHWSGESDCFCKATYRPRVSGVPRGGLGCLTPPPSPKFRILTKAEPNSQFRGEYIHNNLTRIRLSLIFWLFREKPSPPAMTPTAVFFFSLQGMTWRKNKVQEIKKILPYEIKFLVPNYSCLQNKGATAPRSPFSLSSTEFVESPTSEKKFLCTPLPRVIWRSQHNPLSSSH